MSFNIESREPQFGINYMTGHIGFAFKDDFIVSKGIAYFTRWDDYNDIPVSHALVVTGDGKCVEALGEKDEVMEDGLDKYFNDEHYHIFFREPANFNVDVGQRVAVVACSKKGEKYDYGLIVANAIAGTILGHVIDKLTDGAFDGDLCAMCNDNKKWICSELAAYALNEQPEYKGKGVLAKGADTITPQILFEDEVIFKPWKKG